MRRALPSSDDGFAMASVVAMLLVVGIVIGSIMYLAQVNTRAALGEQQSVQALANAESGIDYALAWLSSGAFDPDFVSGPTVYVITDHRTLGNGGYRDVTIGHRGTSEYVITATGYQTRPTGGEVARRVQAAIRLTSVSSGSIFTSDWLSLDPPDPKEKALAYEVIDINVPPKPAWKLPNFGPKVCASRDVKRETCRWTGDYTPTSNTIESAYLSVTGNMKKGQVTATDSVISVSGDLTVGGGAQFENMTFYVGKELLFDGNSTFRGHTTIYKDGDLSIGGPGPQFLGSTTFFVRGNLALGNNRNLRFDGETTVFVDGDLTIDGPGSLTFHDGATFYVNGNVTIKGNASLSGPSGPETPWVVFYVRKGLSIGGTVGAGAPTPNVAFLMDTDPAYSGYSVVLSGNDTFNGGIYAPTRTIEAKGNVKIAGSLIGKRLTLHKDPKKSVEDNWTEKNEARMRSFTLTATAASGRIERLSEWRELR